MIRKIFSLFALSFVVFSVAARADMIGATKTFTLSNGGSCCGTGPFGTITLTQTGTNAITVSETLASGVNFAASAGDALEFNVDIPNTIGSISSGFAVGPAPDAAPPFTSGNPSKPGTFLESVSCTACQGGTGPTSLSFIVTGTNIGLSDFTDVGTGGVVTGGDSAIYFASDVFANGNTGNVGAPNGVVSRVTPEPSSLLMLGTGVMGLAGVVRRKLARLS